MKLVICPAVDEYRRQLIESVVLDSGDENSVINTDSEDEALREIADADAFFGKITKTLLLAARKLAWIQSPTASLEHFLFPELIRHPLVLTNMRGIFSDVIADHVMGYVLCFARNLHRYVRQQVEGRWAAIGGEEGRHGFLAGPGVISSLDRATIHLGDATLGIVGLGAIGREIARRGAAFGMSLLATDAQASLSASRDGRQLPDQLEEIWPPSRLDELLERSDFVCIAAPHTPHTNKLFRAQAFERMKRSAYLINIGRGVIVDLEDLVQALQNGQIAGAALDVFETEPLPEESPLWAMDNVIITPHVAGNSPRVPERHLEVLLENLRRFRSDEPLLNVVDKERWY